MAFTISRRSVLAQLAAIPITSTLARSLRAQTANPNGGPSRFIGFMCNNGTKHANFWPAVSGPETAIPASPNCPLILNTLLTTDAVLGQGTGSGTAGKTDNGLLPHTNLLKGIAAIGGNGGTNGNQHDIGFGRSFTGAQLVSAAGAPYGGAISLDQLLVNNWKGSNSLPCLTTAVYASSIEPHPKTGFKHRASFSYFGPGTNQNLPIIDPWTAFNTAFPPSLNTGGGNTAADNALRQRYMMRQSVLDSVSGDLTDLAAKLGPDDNNKLQIHLNAVRNVEQQLTNLLNAKGGSCPSQPMVSPSPWFVQGGGAMNAAFEVNVETYNDQMIKFMTNLVAAAIICNITRVGTFQFGYGGGKFAFGQLGINLNHHDSIAHHDGTDAATDLPTANYVTSINSYYATMVRNVALQLLHTPEGSGTMLDNTLIVWNNELARGDHTFGDIPVVFIGRVGNGIAKGGRVIDYSAVNGGMTDLTVWGYQALKALGYPSIAGTAWNQGAGKAYSGF